MVGARVAVFVVLAVVGLTLIPQLAQMGDATGNLPVAPAQPARAR
jgi:hypothetical protein